MAYNQKLQIKKWHRAWRLFMLNLVLQDLIMSLEQKYVFLKYQVIK